MAKKQAIPGVAEVPDLQEDAFLRAIIEKPKDDVPRLVYADWLMERGNPWGEFIRCQVLASQKTTAAAEKKQYRTRAKELMKEHQWVPAFFDPDETKVERGFLKKAEVSYDDDAPRDADLAKCAADPFFALLPLATRDGFEPPLLSILTRLPRLGAFKRLDFTSICVGSEENDPDEPESPLGEIFLSSPHLAGIEELGLAATGLKNKAIIALAKNPALTSVRILDIGSDHGMEESGNFFDDKGVKALSESPYLNNLEVLSLSDSWMGDKGVEYLCLSPNLPKLKKLDLGGVSLSNKGYQTLAASPFTARLEALTLSCGAYQDRNLPNDVGVQALADSPHLDAIKKLVIRLDVSPPVAAALRARFGKRFTQWD